MQKENKKNRITVSIAFMATYLTLIFGLLKLANYDNNSLVSQIIYGMFIFHGAIIVFFLFLYLLFSALELNFHKKKKVFLDEDISNQKLNLLKEKFYNTGIDQIFVSFSYPMYLVPAFLCKHFGFSETWVPIVFIPVSIIAYIITYFIFKD